MPKSANARAGIRRVNYMMLVAIVYMIGMDFAALFVPPGSLGIWQLAGTAFFLIVVMIRFLISESFADVAMAQHERMWRALVELDENRPSGPPPTIRERRTVANEDGDFEDKV